MHTLASKLASEEKMTDSTVKKKFQHFWRVAETNAMLDILREMDIMKFLENQKIKT